MLWGCAGAGSPFFCSPDMVSSVAGVSRESAEDEVEWRDSVSLFELAWLGLRYPPLARSRVFERIFKKILRNFQ